MVLKSPLSEREGLLVTFSTHQDRVNAFQKRSKTIFLANAGFGINPVDTFIDTGNKTINPTFRMLREVISINF
ncbi:MAG: hypothetical protein WB791_08180 [Waddliaceae bacterium]